MMRTVKGITKFLLLFIPLIAVGFGASYVAYAETPSDPAASHPQEWVTEGGLEPPSDGVVRRWFCDRLGALTEQFQGRLHTFVEKAAQKVLENQPKPGAGALSKNGRIALEALSASLERNADRLSAEIADAVEAALAPYFTRVYERECDGVAAPEAGPAEGKVRRTVCKRIDGWYAQVEGRVFDHVIEEAYGILAAQSPELPSELERRYAEVLERKFGKEFDRFADQLAGEITIRTIESLRKLNDKIRERECEG